MKHLKLAAIETHVADARTCCLHPASATHRQMSDAELTAAGITPDLVRFSCGLEDSADLIADIEQEYQIVLEEAERRNMGILAVTHNRHLAERISTRVIDLTKA